MPTPMRRTLTLAADRGFALPELDGEALKGRLFEVTRRLATLIGTSALHPVATLRTRRAGRMVRDNGHAVARLLADDVSWSLAGTASVR